MKSAVSCYSQRINIVRGSYPTSAALPAVTVGAGGMLVGAGVAMGGDWCGMDCAEVFLVAPVGTPRAAEGATAGAVLGALAGPTCSQDQSQTDHAGYQHV